MKRNSYGTLNGPAVGIILKELVRRTRVIQIFPNEESLLRMASASRSNTMSGGQWAVKRYLLIIEEARLDRAWSRIRPAV